MIERSDSAKYAKHVFLAGFNDVDIFVEDTAPESPKLYAELLKRALGGQVALAQVFPLGPKELVIARCGQQQGARARKAVFIIDGDFDALNGETLPALRRLYRLKRYSVENYLIHEDSTVAILDEELADRDEQAIRTQLAFRLWIQTLAANLHDFSIACCVAKKQNSGLPTAGLPLNQICSCQTGVVDGAKVAAQITAYETAVDNRHGGGRFAAETTRVRATAPDATDAVLRYIPGKTFLMPLLRRRLQHLFGVSLPAVPFKMRISKRCDVSELQDISAAIE